MRVLRTEEHTINTSKAKRKRKARLMQGAITFKPNKEGQVTRIKGKITGKHLYRGFTTNV